MHWVLILCTYKYWVSYISNQKSFICQIFTKRLEGSPGDAQQNRLTQDIWMPYLLPIQDKCFYLNLAVKYVRSSYIHVWNAVQDQAKPDHAEPNVTCIVKVWCEITTPLRYHTALSGNSLPTFSDNLSVPFSRLRNPKERIQHDWS